METLFTEYYNKYLRALRPFYWVNVEITSKCNLKCKMCPRNAFQSPNQNMSGEVFEKLSKDFTLFGLVDLTGWGEPLLHPDFFKFVRVAKEKRCIVKFVTNGLLLDETKALKTLESGVEWVVFSIDAATEETYRKIRGADLGKVIENVQRLNLLKQKHGAKSPLIDIAIVISKTNITELPAMVKLAKSLNAHRLLVNNMHVVSREEDVDELLYKIDPSQVIDEVQRDACISEAKKLSAELKVNLQFCFKSFNLSRDVQCPMNVDKTLFVAYDGRVSPCCDLGHPVPGVMSRTQIIKNTELVFGNVKEKTIMEIFSSKPYADFRKRMKKGIPEECAHCMLVRGV